MEPRARIPMLPPVLVSIMTCTCWNDPGWQANFFWQNKVVDTHAACWLDFTEDAIITSCNNGEFDALSGMGGMYRADHTTT